MKYFNAIIGLGLAIFSIYLFFTMDTKDDLYQWIIVLLTGILFIVLYLYEDLRDSTKKIY